jgi:hypothetical protein
MIDEREQKCKLTIARFATAERRVLLLARHTRLTPPKESEEHEKFMSPRSFDYHTRH